MTRYVTRGSDNWNKPTVRMHRCHRPDVHGPLVSMDEDKAPWWMVGVFVVGGVYGIALWAMPLDAARASHEPGLASRPGHTVTVAIAEGGR